MQKTVLIEVGDYSDADLPKNANDLLAFWEAELQKVPAEYRESAEIKRFNASYGGDWDDWRTTLEYSRLETAEEQSDREAKAAKAGAKIVLGNDHIELWRDGRVVIRIGNLDQPFVVSGDQVFITDALVKDAGITALSNRLPNWEPKLATGRENSYVAGFGVGLGEGAQCSASAKGHLTARVTAPERSPASSDFEKAMAQGADAVLDYLAGKISDTQLGQSLKEHADPIADRIREVIAEELRAGGMLHRSDR